MIAKDLIDFNIPFLKIEDKTSKALDLMEEFECTRLPVVVSAGYYAGFLEEKIIINCDGKKISDYRLMGENGQIDQGSHYYGIIKCALEFDLPLISIKDDQGLYLGVVPTVSAFETFASCSALLTPGGIIVLSLNNKDYSFSEIGRIIENSDAQKIEIDCYKLNTILENQKIETIDYLNIDAEGNDLKVISTFDFKRFNPSLISIEFNDYEFNNLMNSEINILMENNDYKLISKFGVTCFYTQKKNLKKIQDMMNIQ